MPDKVRKKGEERKHEDSAYPNQKVRRHSWVVDIFLVHG
jgi:hypothetical protein